MRTTFRNQVHLLKENANRFDTQSIEIKSRCLKAISSIELPADKRIIPYYEVLLFLIAYPADPLQLSLSEKELSRVTKKLKQIRKEKNNIPENSGMPFSQTITRFSHDAVQWLLSLRYCTTTLHSFVQPSLQLNDVLRLTLPSLVKSETTAGLSNLDLLNTLLVPASKRLHFLIDEVSRLHHQPYIKDHLFDQLELFVCVTPRDKVFSTAYNRIPFPKIYFHSDLLKKFDFLTLLDSPLPEAFGFSEFTKAELITRLKTAMAVTSRETDPTTYMDESSLKLFHLDRGISIAIYGMIPSRQLPLESYVGYTAFKNGFAAAYGGAWIFGERSNFGINIFESFRSGESGYIMAQLLRVYRHVFKINYFEVEPYQFGLDNPDGIASGAFWFYYRYGFRPLDPYLLQLAKKEAEKIASRKGYRTSSKTLIEFTGSNVGLKLGKTVSPKVADITSRVIHMIAKRFKGNRLTAETYCRQNFLTKTKWNASLSTEENEVLTEVSLWAEAKKVSKLEKLNLMVQMIHTKPKDVYAYQATLLSYFVD